MCMAGRIATRDRVTTGVNDGRPSLKKYVWMMEKITPKLWMTEKIKCAENTYKLNVYVLFFSI